jgi:hypothetical protein
MRSIPESFYCNKLFWLLVLLIMVAKVASFYKIYVHSLFLAITALLFIASVTTLNVFAYISKEVQRYVPQTFDDNEAMLQEPIAI